MSPVLLLTMALLPVQPMPPAMVEAIDKIEPNAQKWLIAASVDAHGQGQWLDYRSTAQRTDFWPASTVKLYACIAALERLNAVKAPLNASLTFAHQNRDQDWVTDCARTMPEMLSEVFRRSSNEDYTLLLRLCGIDHINSQFLIPAKGFPSSAIMRGYTRQIPWTYDRGSAQRISIQAPGYLQVIEHRWSQRSYSAERGCTIIDAQTGNLTSPLELVECLRRIVFHDRLPEHERYAITSSQAQLLCHGQNGSTGLETKDSSSGPLAWTAAQLIFPKARVYHKVGVISNYTLDLTYIDDSQHSGRRIILCPVIAAGTDTLVKGEPAVSAMARVISEQLR
jgi:hypothetical protein